MNKLILASASPRRREILELMNVDFEIEPAELDEIRRSQEAPAAFAARMAREKALHVAARRPDRVVLGADTIVVLDEDILGKPADRAEAADMLHRLSGRWHEVISALALAGPGDRLQEGLNRTRVKFARIPAEWVGQYCSGDEPLDKAGAYAIQGGAARWIPRIDGSYSGVMGLPVFETLEVLEKAGVFPQASLNGN